jgi:hypothetical protein
MGQQTNYIIKEIVILILKEKDKGEDNMAEKSLRI